MTSLQTNSPSEPAVDSIGIVGLGLIGGSFAKALKQAKSVKTVYGFDLRQHEMQTGVRMGVIDHACGDLKELAQKSRVIVLSVPVKAIEPVLSEMAGELKSHHVLTDMGSVKGAVVEAVSRVFSGPFPGFVPGHPIAGSEKSGVAAADAGLFVDHKTILTPLPETSMDALDCVARLWKAAGAQVLMMSAGHHDEVLAATSHLPHLIAFSLVDTLAGADDNKDIFRYAAGGFRDFTRIAASDPVMWHDIYLSNQRAVLKMIDRFSVDLAKLREAIAQGEGEQLLGVFTRAKAAREHFGRMLAGQGYHQGQDKPVAMAIRIRKAKRIGGDIRVCSDKSIAHRAVVLGALAEGSTHIEGFLESEAALASVQAFRDMGVVIEGPDRGRMVIHGVGFDGLHAPPGPLYVGHSATSMRLLSGVMAGQRFASEIVGDATIQQFSMAKIADGLRLMGASIEVGDNGKPPVVLYGKTALQACLHQLDEPSSQLKSGLLFAGLFAEGETEIVEQQLTRDHSERMLEGFGYPIQRSSGHIRIPGRQTLKATQLDIPGDISLATFFIVIASLVQSSDLTLRHLGLNPFRLKAYEVLRKMGADVIVLREYRVCAEPVADLRIRSAPLQGFNLLAIDFYRMRDEMAALIVAALFAESPSTLRDCQQLGDVERQTILRLFEHLAWLGCKLIVEAERWIIQPIEPSAVQLPVVRRQAAGDPFLDLATILAASILLDEQELAMPEKLAETFPDIWSLLKDSGFNIQMVEKA